MAIYQKCNICGKDKMEFDNTCTELSKSKNGHPLVNSIYPAFDIESYSKKKAPQSETTDAIIESLNKNEYVLVEFKGDDGYLCGPRAGYDNKYGCYDFFNSNLQLKYSQNEALIEGNICTCDYLNKKRKLLVIRRSPHLRQRVQLLAQECKKYNVDVILKTDFDKSYKNNV